MKVKIQSTSDVHVDGIKIVVYGESGVGKTRLCATADSPFIISAEGGLLSLQGDNIPYVEVRSLQEVSDAYEFVMKSDEAKQYGTICIDSISELTEVCLLSIKKQMIQESDSGKIDARQAYGKVAESVGTMIRRFRDIPKRDVILVAKQKRVEDESGSNKYEPYLPGKVLPFNLPYLVDEVFCMRVNRDGTRYLQTVGDYKYVAKDRSGKLEPKEEPNIINLFRKIRGQ